MSDITNAAGAPDEVTATVKAERPWYMLVLLALIYIFGSIDRMVPSVIVEPLKAEFQISDSEIGFLTGFAYSIPYALAVLPAGWLIDRFDRRKLLAVTATIWSVLTAAGAGAQSFMMLTLARFGVGASEAPASPGSLSLIGDLFPRDRRATAVSLYYAGTAVGQLVTFLVGGWLLLQFGWRSLFLIAGIPGLILAALLFFTCKEPRRGQFDEAGDAREPVGYKKALAATWASHPLRQAIPANMISTGVNYAIMVWSVSFLVRIHGMNHEYAAMTVGVAVGLIMMFGSIVAGFIADRYAKGDAGRVAQVPGLGTAIAGVFGVAMCLMPTLPLAIGCMAVVGFFMGINTGPGYATLVSLSDSNMRGAILSLAKLASILIGNGFLAFFTGAVSDAIGTPESIRWALLLTMLFFFWASFHFLMVSQATRREVAA